MSSLEQDRLQRELQAALREAPPAEWVRSMIRDYRRDGRYRPDDLRRLLGDPNRAVEVAGGVNLPSAFAAVQHG